MRKAVAAISLWDLVTVGKIAGIGIGSSRLDVLKALGDPVYRLGDVCETGQRYIWSWGILEISFTGTIESDVVWAIHYNFCEDVAGEAEMHEVDRNWLSGTVSLAEAIANLSDSHLSYRVVKAFTSEDETALVLASGVTLFFDKEECSDRMDGMLCVVEMSDSGLREWHRGVSLNEILANDTGRR